MLLTKFETEESTGRATVNQKPKDCEQGHKPVMTISPSFSEHITFSKSISFKETQVVHSKKLTH